MIILAALAAAVGGALPARAQQTAYVGDAWESWGLRQAELPSGTWISSVLDGLPLSGLAMSPAGELFGVAILYTPFPSRPMTSLVKIDVDSHSWQSVGDLALPVLPWPVLESEAGLAFDALGRLWLSTEDGALYQVDPATAALTRRMDSGHPVAGLAGCGATLFGLTDSTETAPLLRLVRIDPDRANVVALPPLPSDLWAGSGVGLDFDAQGRLWAVLNTVSPLDPPTNYDTMVELDPVTGQLIQSHPYFLLGSGLAIAPPPASCPGRGVTEVPTASSVGLVCLAGLLALAGAALLRRPAG